MARLACPQKAKRKRLKSEIPRQEAMARVSLLEMPPGGEIRILNRKCMENDRFWAILVLLGWNPGPVVVLCLGGTLCKFPQRYIDQKLQVSFIHTSL